MRAIIIVASVNRDSAETAGVSGGVGFGDIAGAASVGVDVDLAGF